MTTLPPVISANAVTLGSRTEPSRLPRPPVVAGVMVIAH
jgi:hypothetical protein